MGQLYVVELELKNQKLSEDEVDQMAFRDFECEGKLNFSIDEAKVDELLGEKAFCGGDLPEDVFLQLEEQVSGDGPVRYFWQDKELADNFSIKLTSLDMATKSYDIEEEDWNENWRKSFQKITVSENLSVVPSWEKGEDNLKEVFIYPGMGFGTGNHETTYLCLSLFEEILNDLKEGERCLDFGCGSGILGITAIKKLKSSVDFVDIDADALDNCVQNLQLNEFESYNPYHELVLRERYSLKKEAFPIVFANILENVLEEEREIITDSVAPNGFVIISGLLKGQEKNILAKYAPDFKEVKVVQKGDWMALLLQKA